MSSGDEEGSTPEVTMSGAGVGACSTPGLRVVTYLAEYELNNPEGLRVTRIYPTR